MIESKISEIIKSIVPSGNIYIQNVETSNLEEYILIRKMNGSKDELTSLQQIETYILWYGKDVERIHNTLLSIGKKIEQEVSYSETVNYKIHNIQSEIPESILLQELPTSMLGIKIKLWIEQKQ